MPACLFIFLLFLLAPSFGDVRVGIVFDDESRVCFNLLDDALDFTKATISLQRFMYGIIFYPDDYAQEVGKLGGLNLTAVIYKFEFQLGLLTSGLNIPYYALVSKRHAYPNNSRQLETGDLAMSEAFADLTRALKSFSFVTFICDSERLSVVEDIGSLLPNVPLARITFQPGDTEFEFRNRFLRLSTAANPEEDVFVFIPGPYSMSITPKVLRAALYTGRLTKNQLWFFFSMFLPSDLLKLYRLTPVRLLTMGPPSSFVGKSSSAYQNALCKDAVRHIVAVQKDGPSASVVGETGPLGFDNQGYRQRFVLPYMSVDPVNGSLIPVGRWVKEGKSSSAIDLVPKITLKLPKLRVAKVQNSGRPLGGSESAMTDFFTALAKALDMQVQWVMVSSLGSFDTRTGNWSGMFGAIARGEADIGSLAVPKTAARERYFYFSTPLFRSSFQLVAQTSPKGILHIDLGPFSADLWSAVALGLFLQCLTVLAVSKISTGTTAGALYVVFSGATLSRMPLPSRGPALRFLALCFSFTAFTLTASYAAHTAALSISRAKTKSMGDARNITSGPAYLSTAASSSSPLWFYEAEAETLEVLRSALPDLAKKMDAATQRWWPNATSLYESGASSIARRLNQEATQMFVGFSDITHAVIQAAGDCNLRRIGNPFAFHENALPFRKDWIIKERLLEVIPKIPLQSHVDLAAIDNSLCEMTIKVGIYDTFMIFAMLGGGTVAALIVGVFEVVYRKLAVRWRHYKFTTMHFKFGKIYKACVMDSDDDGVWLSINGRYEREFLPYSRIPKLLANLKKGHDIPVRYLGKSPLTGARLFVHADVKDFQ